MTSIVEVIQHYQRSIDSNQNNEARLLHCINKLYNLPIKVEHLQETGVGKTVNSLRKFNGEIGVAAKTLVTKWKAMVAAEEEPMDTTSQTNESETHNDSNGDDEGTTPRDDGEDENHNRNNTSQQLEENKHRSKDKKDKHKEKHKDRSSSSSNSHKEHKHSSSTSHHQHNSEKSSSKHSSEKHKSSSSSSSKDKEGSSSSSSSKHKDKEREKEKTDNKSHKDKHKESRGGSDHDKEKEKDRSDKKREEKSKTAEKEHKLESPNSSSNHKSNHHSSSSKSKHEDKKEKERSDKHKSSSKDKERTKDQEKSSSSSSSKDKSEHKSSSTLSTSKSSSTKDSDSAERKRRHNSDNDTTDFKSPQPKMAKVHKSSSNSTPASKADSSPPAEQSNDQDVADDSFDSSMGANFDDVLGMLNMPLKKSKKSLKSPSTPTASSSNSSKKDNTTHRSSTASSSSSSKVNGTRVPFSSNNSTSYSTPSTSKSSTMKPDLLAPTAKLEPLDPSIALELPTISTNYKPMPLNQTVMDCVFNNSSSSSKPVRTLTDAEAITHGISSKTMRTKIYSGVRTGQTFQVPTLFDMCIRILQKNIDALEYTGGVPFEVLKPVLERATPQQLYVFEDYNPYVMEDSDVLWQQHVSRNYRTKKRLENESWREMFIRCQEEEERRLSVLKDSIKASQKIAAAPVRKTQLAFVDSMVKPPRNILKKQEQYGTKSKMVATPAARVASLSSVTPNAAKTGDQRLRVPSTARDHAQVSSSSIRPKKAPLMQKTLQFIRGRHKR